MDKTVIDSYPRYESYKDSGVDWLEYIPEDWQVWNSKWLFACRKEKARKNDEQLTASQKHGVIPQKLFMQLEGRKVTTVFLNHEILKHVEKGDFVISMRSFQGGIEYCNYKGSVSSAYVSLIPNDTIHAPFYKFLLKSKRYIEALQSTSNLVRDGQALRYDNFCMVPLILIPLKEQKSIASFLSTKTTQIDQAITLKQQQIAKLEEYKQIVIQNAVTKGLNPDVPMKDSGVNRIDKLPEHWKIKKFRFSFKFQRGLNITKDDLRDEGVLCLNYGEIHSKYGFELLPEHTLKYVDKKYIETNSKSLLDDGDFVFADTSEDTEGSGNFSYVNGKMQVFAGYHTLIAKPIISFDSRFMAYLLDSRAFRGQVRQKVKGVKVYSITQSILKGTYIWLPPREEQKAIVKKLDSEMSLVNQTIQSYKTQIERLKEYKTILINQAVTGKIKVS